MNLNSPNSFIGTPINGSLNCRICVFPLSVKKLKQRRKIRYRKFVCCRKHNDWNWIAQAIRFSHFCGKNVEIFRNAVASRNGLYGAVVKEPLLNSKALIHLVSSLWNEGLFLVRCSAFIAVISGVSLLVWYGQCKAKSYAEKNLLPTVTSLLSDYLQREINFGTVKSISPLAITLESCSIGPHSEEFSCSEVPLVKVRLFPFASLRSGKVVIDAVLCNPTVLVAQKKDYTWLGLPYPSEDVIQRHSSTEEGIDFRTKTRRVAREDLASRWALDRDKDAKEAADNGYFLPERGAHGTESYVIQENDDIPQSESYKSFLSDEKTQWRDHQCMDTDLDYDVKHADLEKSFGVKFPGSGLRFLSRENKGTKLVQLEKKSNRITRSTPSDDSKLRVLNRSSSSAISYFNALSSWNDDEDSLFINCYDNALKLRPSIPEDDSRNDEIPDKLAAGMNSLDKKEYFEKKVDKLEASKDSYLQTLMTLKEAGKLGKNTLDDEKGSLGEKEVVDSLPDFLSNDGTMEVPENNSLKSDTMRSTFDWSLRKKICDFIYLILFSPAEKLKQGTEKMIDISNIEFIDGMDVNIEPGENFFPILLDSVQFKGGNLMLLAYGDREPREMENVNGHVKLRNDYGRVYVQLSGDCKMWKSDAMSDDGGWLSADVFVDIIEQQWHANLKISNFFAPLFERILEIPITWSDGRAIGEVHMCMSRGESFPNLHGQIDVTGLSFKIFDSPSPFTDVVASLRFRGQRIFVHNASGCFGSVPLEASGDFGIHPEEGEYHLMCQVPSVEVNALMRTFKMKPLLFPVAGSVTAVFNCQGPLDAPIFVGSGMASRKISNTLADIPVSAASEAVLKNKEAGAIAAFDRIPISYLSANFTFNTDNCVADLYGIRASLLDGGEVRGAGNAWVCPEGEIDDNAMDINFSGNLFFDKIMDRYLPGYLSVMPVKMGDLTGETKLTGSLLKPRFDIKWVAPVAEGSFTDARGDIIISHDYITINSSSAAFDLYSKIYTTYLDKNRLESNKTEAKKDLPFSVDGIELDLRMRGFEFFALDSSYPFDSPRPTHLKATGKLKFQGTVMKSPPNPSSEMSAPPALDHIMKTLAGEVSITGLRLNQLTLAPQLTGYLSISRDRVKLDATGRPDESLVVDVQGSLHNISDERPQNGRLWSFSLQKGQLKASFCYRPMHTAALEIRNLPLDELELASLRGTIQKAEIQLSLLKRRGSGVLSVLHPKFSGVLGEAFDVAAKWSGDVITIEKAVLEQTKSQYELQGEYVLPGTRDRILGGKDKVGLLERAMAGQLSSVISSMGRWRMRLEVPHAEVSEMLPLARLLSRSKDPAVRSRSKEFFMQTLQAVTLVPDTLQQLLEVVRGYYASSTEVIPEDFSLPDLMDLKGYWRGALDASGGGNGDTVAEFDFHGEDWEWGAYKTQRVLAGGAYSNNDGLRLDKIFIQKDNATVHADGTLFGPKTNLHFAVLNFPINLVPTLAQIIESSAAETVHSLRQFLSPIRGVLHMEGDLRGSIIKPECDVQVRLLDGSIGGIDLGRAEVAASVTPNSRFLFNAKLEPSIQNGHVHVQGSVPITFVNASDEKSDVESSWNPVWVNERVSDEKNLQEGWDTQLAESLKVLNWNFLDAGEVRLDADIKDGGMTLLTALSPHANWLHGNADVMLEVRGTVDQPILDGFASFHRASISSPFLTRPLTNLGGTLHIKSNKLCITSLESRVSRRGKLLVKGNLPFKSSEASLSDKIDLKCEDLEIRAKNLLSAQVDTQLRVTGSMMQPNISGSIKLSHGEAYLPHDKGSGNIPFNRLASDKLVYFPRVFTSEPAAHSTEDEKDLNLPKLDARLGSLKVLFGPELRIVYPLILNFGISGELELNGLAHPKWIKPKGMLAFENGDVNLVATQVRLKRDHSNVAKFEPENGLDPMLDLALVGSEWQFRIQSRASSWQQKLVVTSVHSVEQDALSPSEAARVFESQLAESILESDGKLAFKKLATATLETLMPRIEGKGEFGHARWRLVYAPQIPSLLSVDPTVDPLKSLASNISFGTEVEVQLGKRIQASIVRQMKDSEMAVQWTLIYQLTSRLRVLLQSSPTKRLIFEYSATTH